ncbi:Mannosyl-glycoprotein endo-beta-N-acetylglucosaminidase [Fictibacillus solisalsi]|uniref:Mannosyl-glycoprotein endo-beta-N-acetylglucosaminidase n=1 Tax=Fictibacillus solisalsi TaxID=459525 RepID=A0A1G9TVV3_9BACL|nr:SH3 domain-containing protein [Fictibacillus solisalsi]SDM51900.1 Mannosyl-glycoprotein endo-beta-N-acetylglucosaminidase [Fictibacillus solisalsi]
MKKLVIPGFCFAVLSTTALYQAIEADPASAQELKKKVVNVQSGSSLNIRKNANTSSPIIGKLVKGVKVTVYSESKGWSKLKAGSGYGYVSSKYLITSATTAAKVKTTTKYVKVSEGSLNLRKSASAGASVIAKLARGTQVTVYSETGGWAKINANGKNGYVSSKYLSSSKPSNTVSKGSTSKPAAVSSSKTTTKYVKVSGALNLRKAATTNSAVIKTLKNGLTVTVYSESKGWAKIKASGSTGFVSTKYLTATKPGSTAKPTPADEPKMTKKYVKVSGALNLRKDATTKSAVIKTLKDGEEVTVYSESSGWAKIKVGSSTGYVSTKYLTAAKPDSTSKPKPVPEPKTTTKYVKVSGALNLRKDATTKSAVIKTLKDGEKVTVYSESSGWAKIKVGSSTGYVSTKYLTAAKPGSTSKPKPVPEPKTTTKYVKVSGALNLRKDMTTKSAVIKTLKDGAEVTVYSEMNGWAKVKAGSSTGYVSTKYLTSTKPGTPKPSPAPKPSEPETAVRFVDVDASSSLNVRSGPGTTFAVVTKLARDTAVTLLSQSGSWSKISANGKTGYVSTSYLKEKLGSPDGIAVSETGQKYNLTLDDMVKLQMGASPQTDQKYKSYIREDAIRMTSSIYGTVLGDWNIRGGAGTNYWKITTVRRGEQLKVLSRVKGSDGHIWYQVEIKDTWVNASPEDVKYYLDPNNFKDDPVKSYQFVKLSQTANLNAAEVNQRILSGKGILEGKASSFIKAGNLYGVNDIYLISHALLETGNGRSQLATGVQYNGRIVYNMYGIGANDGNAVQNGAAYAYNAGWFTPEDAIVGGARFIAMGYINKKQDTIYKMRWNPSAAEALGYPSHQYATDIGWASKQVRQIYNLYSLLNNYSINLEIPVYKTK